jgi:hypothetical protein
LGALRKRQKLKTKTNTEKRNIIFNQKINNGSRL